VKEGEPRVCVIVFDCMHLNGRSLLDQPLRARRQVLRESFHRIPARLDWARGIDLVVPPYLPDGADGADDVDAGVGGADDSGA